ncbi:MAG TPA: neutral zinc metallopeptidase, partial [Paracoccaceae bacterium]|nr:neutral zinc metallopeptidase [Paracoccaceae bacterium]
TSLPAPQAALVEDLHAVWTRLFADILGAPFGTFTVVIPEARITTPCGRAGPDWIAFFCPENRTTYIGLGFIAKFAGAPGVTPESLLSFVIAHEFGHHVQLELEATGRPAIPPEARARLALAERIKRHEVQANCYVGVFLHHAPARPGQVTAAAIEAALAATQAVNIGSHGSLDQRLRWFRAGLAGGSIEACDTFAADHL